jgi:hypothetical protein
MNTIIRILSGFGLCIVTTGGGKGNKSNEI